jgi:hypothetical protein
MPSRWARETIRRSENTWRTLLPELLRDAIARGGIRTYREWRLGARKQGFLRRSGI